MGETDDKNSQRREEKKGRKKKHLKALHSLPLVPLLWIPAGIPSVQLFVKQMREQYFEFLLLNYTMFSLTHNFGISVPKTYLSSTGKYQEKKEIQQLVMLSN